jgi:hypothetical protein
MNCGRKKSLPVGHRTDQRETPVVGVTDHGDVEEYCVVVADIGDGQPAQCAFHRK